MKTQRKFNWNSWGNQWKFKENVVEIWTKNLKRALETNSMKTELKPLRELGNVYFNTTKKIRWKFQVISKKIFEEKLQKFAKKP